MNLSAKSGRVEQLSSSQRVLLALDEAINKLEAVERAKTEPIAVIGMSCRFPGGATDPNAFWQVLINGVDAVTEVPSDRWNVDAFYNPDPEVPGKMYTRWGGFLQQVDQFDAQFFGISPREAVKLDPQQRLLLEVSWEALEQAGLVPNQPAINQTGVFIGITTNDYARRLMPAGDLDQIDAYYLTGNPLNAVAGRLSYTLGLQGPCMAIDTACSSSLVSVHVACQSLRNGECNQALAGGVNLILTPENTVALSKAKMMAADGRCKTFDADANGIVRGEGCGILVLKRLSDAIADGDNILALIRGSAVNQDGPSSGFTVPNKAAQEVLLRQVLSRAKVAAADVDYVEAHGTGTPLGDPIEVRALGAVLGEGRTADNPLKIGSVKTNLGHLESAAGVAGLIKVILSLQHQQIPPHLHLRQPNPYINWADLPISVTTQTTAWPSGEKQRLAGVSSFGASGTNAHVLLEEAPRSHPKSNSIARPLHVLTLSAKTKEALRQLSDRYHAYLSHNPVLEDVCFSANTGRSHFKHRLAIVANSPADAAEKLARVAQDQDGPGITVGQVEATTAARIAFLFTGQGSQYVHMGRQLYETQPVFRDALDRCNGLLHPHLGCSLLERLYPTAALTDSLDDTAFTQPALFALEYALCKLWQSWGVEPSVVMGHSVGEYVAACVAGVFSLEDGLKLIAARGRLMQALPQDGAMVAVMADPAQVKAALEPYAQQVAIAAINGPRSVVISGLRSSVQAVCATLEAQGAKTKPLQVSHAFHSPLMEPMLADFRQVASEVTYAQPQLKLVSNLTGQPVGPEIATPDYWCRHIPSAVQFAASMQTLGQQGYDVFVEIGPKPILLGMGRTCLPESEALWLPSLRANQPDWQSILESLSQLYLRGVGIDWTGFDRPYARHRLPLPTYPFQKQRFWVESVEPTRSVAASLTPNGLANKIVNPLVGHRLQLAGSTEIRFEAHISQQVPGFLEHHRIYDAVILPATAYMEIALSAGAAVLKSSHLRLETVAIQQALMLAEDDRKTLQVVLKPEGDGYSFQIFSLSSEEDDGATWVVHASGVVKPGTSATPEISLEMPQGATIAATDYYQGLRDRGFDYGPKFQAIQQLWKRAGGALGRVQLPESLAADISHYQLHPVLLDACFQVLGTSFPDDAQQDVYLPVGVEQLQMYRNPTGSVWSQVQQLQVKDGNQQHLRADLCLFDEAGAIVAQLQGLSFRRVTRKAFARAMRKALQQNTSADTKDWLYQISWRAKALDTPVAPAAKTWLVFADASGTGLKLIQKLQERGDRCILVFAGDAYQQVSDTHYQVNPANPQEFQDCLWAAQSNYDGVLYLWGLDALTALTADLKADALCGGALHLVQALTTIELAQRPQLWLVTQGAQAVGDAAPLQVQQATLWGMGRVIALEHPELRCVRLDLDPAAEDALTHLVTELQTTDGEDQVAYRQDVRYVARLDRHRPQAAESNHQLSLPNEPFRLQLSDYGTLENLTLAPLTRRSPAPGEVEIQVRAVGLNFRDVLNALGMLKDYTEQMGIAAATDLPFGGECAGRVVAVGEGVTQFQVGDEVIAAQTIGSLASFVHVRSEFVIHKPAQLSFEEAATIPTTFLTAYYGLYRQAKVQPGERVLIHAAAGGVGQAAIQLVHRRGARVYATASPSKWEFLRSQGVEQVMNSRSLEFAEQIPAATAGAGIDVVLNSLNGDYIPKSLEVLNQRGRFVEIGKLGIWDHAQMQANRPDIAYFPFDLLDISLETPGLIAELLGELMQEFRAGALQPLPHKVFTIQDTVSAFRYMAQSKHIGKVVISIPESPTAERQRVRSDASYLITGGLGALGLKVARWLVDHGARHLVLTGRRGLSDAAQLAIRQLSQAGAQVQVVQADVAERPDVNKLLQTIQDSQPPLRGIIHAAGVLEDGMLRGQTWESFQRVLAPKVAGAWHLHSLTQELPLDFFICFSSVSALLGSPGQSNYAAANAFMDALAHHRRSQGLPGLSINWGPWSEGGMAAALSSREQARWAAQGVKTIAPDQGLQVLTELLESSIAQVGVLPVEWSKFLSQFPQEVEFPFLESFAATVEPSPAQRSEFRQQLDVTPAAKRRSMLMAHVQSEIAKVLNLSTVAEIDPHQGFLDLGMDSLMAVELRNRLQTSLECTVPASLAFDYPTVTALVDYLAEAVAPVELAPVTPEEPVAPTVAEASPIVESALDELSDSEAEALLLSKLERMRY